MRAKPTRGQRITAVIIAVVVVVLFAVLGAAHHASPAGGDPCRSGNTPQVCEAQHAIDKQHEASNVIAAEADEAHEGETP